MPNTLGLDNVAAKAALIKQKNDSKNSVLSAVAASKKERVDPNKLVEQLKETELNRRQASLLINYHINQTRDLLDRVNYLLNLCNTQKTIEAPPPR
ncbi:MAG: hypothetical protein KBE16_08570 [Alphaproteobacteria bacterium]|jgi:hypothetical protein|nr:hypothetical protein [Alphaproteobacteria bacterium]MBP9878252.1 hypothetical protein [Alphaproteobacteria bacterium]